MQNKPIIILGKTNTGKSTIAKLLEARMKGLKRNITYTTRPIRPGEVDGVDYNYVSKKDFHKLAAEGKFAEYVEYNASYGTCCYGSTIESYKPDTITVLNPIGVMSVLKKIKDVNVIYLKASDDILEERAIARGDGIKEIKRRLFNDGIDFADIDDIANLIIDTSFDTPEDIVEKIIKHISLEN